jgi:hypothetical protein
MPSLRSLPLSAHGAGQCRKSRGVRPEPGSAVPVADGHTSLEKRRLLWRLCSESGLAELVVVLLAMAALARQARELAASPVG